jgi:hypothetical protein
VNQDCLADDARGSLQLELVGAQPLLDLAVTFRSNVAEIAGVVALVRVFRIAVRCAVRIQMGAGGPRVSAAAVAVLVDVKPVVAGLETLELHVERDRRLGKIELDDAARLIAVGRL